MSGLLVYIFLLNLLITALALFSIAISKINHSKQSFFRLTGIL